MQPEIDWTKGVVDFGNGNEKGPHAQILFLGDLCPAGCVEGPLLTQDAAAIFGGLREYMQTSNLVVFNLEAPLTTSSHRIRKSGTSLKASPRVAQVLADAGLNVACLANNHILDYGLVGAKETWDHLVAKSITPVGIGQSKEKACESKTFEINGIKIELINSAEAEYSRAGDESCGACDHSFRWHASKTIRSDDIDLRIAVLHGGKEYVSAPPPHTYNFIEELKDLGFALVIGHHSHVPQGIRASPNSFIAYGLGNVLFDAKFGMAHPLFRYGYGVLVTVSARKLLSVQILPYRVGQGWKLELLEGRSKEKFLQMLQKRSSEVENLESVEKLWAQLAWHSSRSTYLPSLAGKTVSAYSRGSPGRLFMGLMVAILSAIRGFVHRTNDNEFLSNTIATATHREYLLEILRSLQADTGTK